MFFLNFAVFLAALPNQWQAILCITNALDYSSLCTWHFFNFLWGILGKSFFIFDFKHEKSLQSIIK
jgi:hypothetical protein